MFKKERDLAERSKTLLKNKEVRTLKADIIKKFPSVQEEELNAVIPNKANITVTKLANKTLLYSIDGVTLLFDIEGRNNLCPALPFLWKFPTALPTFVIHSPVSEFVLRGADLMLPGVCKSKIVDVIGFNLKEGDKACMRVAGNPLPFAVGDCLISSASLSAGKCTGRALSVLHVYGDLISTASVVPNSGFGPSRIYALEGFTEPGAVDELGEYDSDDNSDSSGEEEGEGEEAGDQENEKEVEVGVGVEESFDGLNLSSAADGNEGLLEDSAVTEGETGNETVAPEQMDALLLQATLLASKYVIKDKQLPMLVSTYWSLLQRCALAAELGKLDIKRSSFRKVTPYLAHCARLELLVTQEDSGVATVTKLNKTHDLFRGAKVENPEQFKLAVLSSTSTAATPSKEETVSTSAFAQYSAAAADNSNSSSAGGSKKLQMLELFKLTKHLRDVFGTPRGEYGEYLRAHEVRDIMTMYIRSHSLECETDRSSLLIPPADPVHKLLASYSSANTTKNTEIKHTAAVSVPVSVDRDAMERASEPDDESESLAYYEADISSTGAYTASGMSGVADILKASSSSNGIKMKIHSGGLKSVEGAHLPGTNSPSVTPIGASVGAAAGGGRPLGVGGWGVDKGAEWKPVSLSTARATATASAVLDQEFPSLGSAATQKTSKSNPRSTAKASKGNAVYSELPTELLLRKDEVYKAILKKMSPYFGVIAPNGALTVHSGQVPKAKILVERRMGNKAVTLLRGLEVFGIDLNALAKDCQKKFACSVALSAVPGIAHHKEVVIQGNLAYEAEVYLVEQRGVPKSLIDIDASKGAKLKKKK